MKVEDEIQYQLVVSLKRDSIEAFNAIYSLYSRKLLLYVAKVVKNKEDAEEIVHDIFLNLWNFRKKIKADTNLTTLLFSIAYKRRIDFLRKSLNSPIYEDYMDFQNELTSEDTNNLEYADFCNMFNQALKTLPPRLQSFIVLSRIRGFTIEEIASKLHVSKKTVNNGLSEGLKILRERFKTIMNHNKS